MGAAYGIYAGACKSAAVYRAACNAAAVVAVAHVMGARVGTVGAGRWGCGVADILGVLNLIWVERAVAVCIDARFNGNSTRLAVGAIYFLAHGFEFDAALSGYVLKARFTALAACSRVASVANANSLAGAAQAEPCAPTTVAVTTASGWRGKRTRV